MWTDHFEGYHLTYNLYEISVLEKIVILPAKDCASNLTTVKISAW